MGPCLIVHMTFLVDDIVAFLCVGRGHAPYWVLVSEVSDFFFLLLSLTLSLTFFSLAILVTDDDLETQIENSGKYILLHKWYSIFPLNESILIY